MPDKGTMADNVQKGRGVVKKDGFKVVGTDASDRDHHEIIGDAKKGRGRPGRGEDKNFTVVGKTPEQEQGTQEGE